MNSKSSLFALLFLAVGNNLQLLCKAQSNNFTTTTATDRHDVIRVRTRREGGRQDAEINEVAVERSLYRDPMDRQGDVWKMINSMETYKTNSRQFASTSNGRKTFSKYHYKVVPIFWNRKTWSSQKMDISSINNSMQMAVDNYDSQSWNKLDLSFEVVPQTEHILSSADSVGEIRWGVKDILSKLGYTKDVDYDGIIVIYNTLGGDGDFCCSGGKAYLGGSLASVSYDPSWSIIRHEIGHNFGHEHHMHNHYRYRDNRPNRPGLTDGFDMMSGGNRYERSDFGLASKWFYNWVSDSNIVSMQPEGKTDACPSCVKSGTFTMKAFDDWWNTPGDNDVMGIHIPIMTQHDSSWGNDLVYSYWLSYRTGVDGKLADGLSIHLAWFELEEGLNMGAYYDSLSYDVVGYSDDRADSMLVVDSCYHVSPAPYVLDRDLISANAVQPVVCVDSINKGSDITVSVSFIDPNNNPPGPSSNVVEYTASCSTNLPTSETFEMSAKTMNVVRVDGMGKDGIVTVSLASDIGWAFAYFYDGYPYSPSSFNSDPAYGSMKRLSSASVTGEDGSVESMSYSALFGEVYTVVPANRWAKDEDKVVVTFSCKVSSCLPNEYNTNGECNKCPVDHRSNAGATSVSQCWACAAGTYLAHPHATECSLDNRTPTAPFSMPMASPVKAPITSPVAPVASPVSSPVKDDDDYYAYDDDETGPTKVDPPTIAPIITPAASPVSSGTDDNRPSFKVPTRSSSKQPTTLPPTASPSRKPSKRPTPVPSVEPSKGPTTSPSLHPSTNPSFRSADSDCEENLFDQFLMKIKKNGNPILRNCRWLASKGVNRQAKECADNMSFEQHYPAKAVCHSTCGTCATVNLSETGSAQFFLRTKIRNGIEKPVKKSCKWLTMKNTNRIQALCSKTKRKFGFGPAKEVCPITCA